jgi:hypothetical protein
VGGIRDVADKITEIAQASSDQSASLIAVSHSIGDLDDITRHNASMVNASNDATTDLIQRASSLQQAVNGIRLWQGSVDEAHALVDRAADLITSQGLEAATQQIHDPDGCFIDRDLYVFGIDRAGVYRLMGADPARVGQLAPLVPAGRELLLVEALWQAADAGGGWVDYQLSHPETLEMIDKSSYARAIDSDLVVACGVYKHARQAGAGATAEARSIRPVIPMARIEEAEAVAA